jgi:ribonucleoside-diphosphate reductase beta chain
MIIGQLVTKWFRKPEIIMMAVTLWSFETIHAEAYSLLNENLDLIILVNFWKMKLQWLKLKLLLSVRDSFNGETNWHEIAKSLAIFSAFTEGVNLFLPSPSYYLLKCETSLREWVKLLNGLLEMNPYTQKQDVGYLEHLIEENPEFKTPELEAAINEAALLSLQLELDFIR